MKSFFRSDIIILLERFSCSFVFFPSSLLFSSLPFSSSLHSILFQYLFLLSFDLWMSVLYDRMSLLSLSASGLITILFIARDLQRFLQQKERDVITKDGKRRVSFLGRNRINSSFPSCSLFLFKSLSFSSVIPVST